MEGNPNPLFENVHKTTLFGLWAYQVELAYLDELYGQVDKTPHMPKKQSL